MYHKESDLVHLARQLAPVCVDVELAEHVARRQRHDACNAMRGALRVTNECACRTCAH